MMSANGMLQQPLRSLRSQDDNAAVGVYRKRGILAILLLGCVHLALAQIKDAALNASICQLFENPSKYEGKLVRIRAVFVGSFESSGIVDPKCHKSIWLTTPSGLLRSVGAILISQRSPSVPRADFELVKDKDDEKFDRLTSSFGKSNWPYCADYKVTATFTGRLDHRLDFVKDEKGANGFGHMGLSEFQIVLRSVSDVQSEDDPCEFLPHPTLTELPDHISDAR